MQLVNFSVYKTGLPSFILFIQSGTKVFVGNITGRIVDFVLMFQ